jgi:hypothetical protein
VSKCIDDSDVTRSGDFTSSEIYPLWSPLLTASPGWTSWQFDSRSVWLKLTAESYGRASRCERRELELRPVVFICLLATAKLVPVLRAKAAENEFPCICGNAPFRPFLPGCERLFPRLRFAKSPATNPWEDA